MADFPSTVPIRQAAEAIDERPYAEARPRTKKKPPPPMPEPVEESGMDEPEEDQPKHTLDLDA